MAAIKEQKKVRVAIQERELIDEFIATFSAIRKKAPEELLSYCVWTANQWHDMDILKTTAQRRAAVVQATTCERQASSKSIIRRTSAPRGMESVVCWWFDAEIFDRQQ